MSKVVEEPCDADAEGEPSGSQSKAGEGAVQEFTKQDSLQRIQIRKKRVLKFPREQKIIKLSMFSHCQAPDCTCNGWKTPENERHRDIEHDYRPHMQVICRNVGCCHPLQQHVSHLTDIKDAELDELLGAIVDAENIYASLAHEKDEDTRKVFTYLFRVKYSHFLCINTIDMMKSILVVEA